MVDAVVVESKPLEPVEVDFEFRHEILVVTAGLPWCNELIATAERMNAWNRATIVNANEPEYHHADRNNDALSIEKSHHELGRYFELLTQAVHQCAMVYKALNKYVTIRGDTGYQLLRYRPGQHFHEHVDNIAGHTSWGQRQLSAIVYLNDDYTGGELEFPRQKLKLKAKPGSVVLFPSHYTHPHASLDIEAGVKYSVVTWFI